MTKLCFCATAAVALACVWCGNPHGLHPVSGKVTFQGDPAAGAAIFFQLRGADPMKQQTIMGIVQADGSFTLDCGRLGKGAPPGEYDVLVEWKHDPNLAGARPLKATRKAAQPDRLRGRYADPKVPRLHTVIKAGTNELPPFELTDQ